MTLAPNVAVLVVTTFAVGILMAICGVQKRALEWKQRRRICPSCGRQLRSGCVCH
jgi:hypothetical protein